MRKNNEQSSTQYSTLDAYQAGFLALRQHTPSLIQQGSKIVFVFKASETLYKDLDDYNAGATISAIRFTLAIKNLKSQIFSMRRNNENGQGKLDSSR